MKKLLFILMSVALVLSLSSCALVSRVRLDKDAEVTLIFDDINVVLTDEEADRVFEIFDGAKKQSLFWGTPSCGFDENVALQIGMTRFKIACDTCGTALVGVASINISEKDIDYIHELFEKYGGHFPCI